MGASGRTARPRRVFNTTGQGTSERRALTSLEEVVNVADDTYPGNQVADLGTGRRKFHDDSDDDKREADGSQVQRHTPGLLPAGPMRRTAQSLLHPLGF